MRPAVDRAAIAVTDAGVVEPHKKTVHPTRCLAFVRGLHHFASDRPRRLVDGVPVIHPLQQRLDHVGRRRQLQGDVHAAGRAACLETMYPEPAIETCTPLHHQKSPRKSSTSRRASRALQCAKANHRVHARPVLKRWNRLGGWSTTDIRKWA